MRGIDMHTDAVLAVADELAGLLGAMEQLAGCARRCPLTQGHFGVPDAGRRLASAVAAQRGEIVADLGGWSARVGALADDLRASAAAVTAADRCAADGIRAAGLGTAAD
jgi:hypothetical protein